MQEKLEKCFLKLNLKYKKKIFDYVKKEDFLKKKPWEE